MRCARPPALASKLQSPRKERTRVDALKDNGVQTEVLPSRVGHRFATGRQLRLGAFFLALEFESISGEAE
jgi:hypothetical protein